MLECIYSYRAKALGPECSVIKSDALPRLYIVKCAYTQKAHEK